LFYGRKLDRGNFLFAAINGVVVPSFTTKNLALKLKLQG
jgi:hypothetical protein